MIEDLQAALTHERVLAQDAHDALETCGARLDALVAQNIIRGRQIETLEAARESLAADLQAARDAIDALGNELAARDAALASLDRERAALVSAQDALVLDRDALRAARDSLDAERTDLSATLDALRSRLHEPRYVVADRVSRALRPLGPIGRALRRAAIAIAGR